MKTFQYLHNVNSDELKTKTAFDIKRISRSFRGKQPEAHGKHTVPKLVGVK